MKIFTADGGGSTLVAREKQSPPQYMDIFQIAICLCL